MFSPLFGYGLNDLHLYLHRDLVICPVFLQRGILVITENYTRRVRKAEYTALVPEQRLSDLEYNLRQLSDSNLKLRNENTIMAARILHLELMLTDKEYRKEFKKQNKSK